MIGTPKVVERQAYVKFITEAAVNDIDVYGSRPYIRKRRTAKA
jgi:hypothetical protein